MRYESEHLINLREIGFISLMVEDTLRGVTQLDVARLEVGTGSIAIHLEEKLADNVTDAADGERTIRGSTFNVRGEFLLPLGLSLEGGYLIKDYDDEAERDYQDTSFELVYRFFIP